MADKPVTRSELQRKLVVNALTKPVNVSVPAGVAVAAVLVGVPWLLVVAAIAYVALAAMTFFDEREAEQVGDETYGRQRRSQQPRLETRRLAPEIRAEVEAARAEQARITETIANADLPFDEVGGEVERLVVAMEATARRAQLVRDYLVTQDIARIEARLAQASEETAAVLRDQLAVLESLVAQLRRFHDEMEQVNAALGAMHARLVGAAVASQGSADAELAGDVRELRQRVETLTEGITEAYAATSQA
jgi:predicted  nucleic acid-binding Zn-ribbon protein